MMLNMSNNHTRYYFRLSLIYHRFSSCFRLWNQPVAYVTKTRVIKIDVIEREVPNIPDLLINILVRTLIIKRRQKLSIKLENTTLIPQAVETSATRNTMHSFETWLCEIYMFIYIYFFTKQDILLALYMHILYATYIDVWVIFYIV